MIPRILSILAVSATPILAKADVSVLDCGWQASAEAIVEPWNEHTRTFSEGKTRLAMLDTVEPALGWAYLLVLSPPYAELGDRQCKVIGWEGSGFAGMEFARLTARYDPATGLTFTLPVQVYDPATGLPGDAMLTFTLNQATGAITPALTR